MLHPTLKEIIRVTEEANNPPLRRMSLAEIRKGPYKLKALAAEPRPMANVLNHMIHTEEGNLLMRLYYPKEAKALPLLLYFHPGGFVKGDIDAHDSIYRSIAESSGCIVTALNYPLAPEQPFPHGIKAAKAALHWIYTHPKELKCNGKIAICGEDAGGNIAAVLTHEVRDEIPIAFQVLIYPQTDLTFSTLSHQEYRHGYLLEREALEWYREQYIGTHKPEEPRISPLFAEDFSGLPPAFVITAEFDPMRDEGEAYAQKLKSAGVPVIHKRYKGMIHGFFQMTGLLDEARLAIEEVSYTLKKAFK